MPTSPSLILATLLLLGATAPTEVELTSLTLTDNLRSRTIPVQIAFPTPLPATKLPLVIVSHTGGGNTEQLQPLLSKLALAGYLAVAPTHEDSAVGSGGGAASRPRQPLRAGVPLWEFRAKDISHLAAADWDKLLPTLAGKIDTSKVAVIGFGQGAYTALLVGGALPVWNKTPADLRDARVSALVLLSPPPSNQQGLTPTSFAALTLPILSIASPSPTTRPTPSPHDLSPEGNKFMLSLTGATAATLLPIRKDTPTSNAATLVTIAFLDAFLKSDPAAKDLLVSGSVIAGIRDIATFQSR